MRGRLIVVAAEPVAQPLCSDADPLACRALLYSTRSHAPVHGVPFVTCPNSGQLVKVLLQVVGALVVQLLFP